MDKTITPARSYRAYLHPVDSQGYPLPAETGVLKQIQLKARSAEAAAEAAHHVTGQPVVRVERVEQVEAVEGLVEVAA